MSCVAGNITSSKDTSRTHITSSKDSSSKDSSSKDTSSKDTKQTACPAWQGNTRRIMLSGRVRYRVQGLGDRG